MSSGKDEHHVVREAASAALPQHSSVISDFPTAAYIVLTWSSRERKLGTRRVQKYIEKRARSGNHHDLLPKPALTLSPPSQPPCVITISSAQGLAEYRMRVIPFMASQRYLLILPDGSHKAQRGKNVSQLQIWI